MRGQAHTLEAIVAGIVLLSSLVFALQVTAVTPLSASTASQHIENQQQAVAEGVLTVADEQGSLHRAVLYWGDNDSNGAYEFHDAERSYYVNDPPPNEFGAVLARGYSGRGIAYNVYVVYDNGNGASVRQRMVYRGEPSDNAVSASRTVTLYDDDVLFGPDGQPTATTLAATDNFYAPDVSPTGVYNVVRVEVVAWRM